MKNREEMHLSKDDNKNGNSSLSTAMKLVCCDMDYCRQCCDTITGVSEKKKLTKDDIQHPVITHQPITKLDSFGSQNSSTHKSRTSRLSSSGYYSNWSSQNSPVFSGQTRERVDSENSHSSRKDSNSSSIPDSPASFGSRKSTNTPMIDMKPIEFWAANRAENVQPRPPHRRRLPSESEISIEDFNPDIYEPYTSEDSLTDEEKLARYKLGQIHFGIQFEIPSKSLIVKIIEAKELAPPYCQDISKQDMAHSNPYAKVCLLPNLKDSRQTTVQRKTQEPQWNENVRYELPFKELQRRTLEITVKDFDKFSRHCVIGKVCVPLEHINLVKGIHMWKPLQPAGKEDPDLGDILLSLNYLPSAGRLNVDVIKAKQLIQTDLIGGSDPYVKASLLNADHKTIKTRKTTVKKNTLDPIYNETLSFNVTPDILEDCSLHVGVWDYNTKCKDDFVGRIILSNKGNTGMGEMNHWTTMVNCQRSAVAQWHTLQPIPENDDKSTTSCSVLTRDGDSID